MIKQFARWRSGKSRGRDAAKLSTVAGNEEICARANMKNSAASNTSANSQHAPAWLLHRADQAASATLILFGLLATVAWCWVRGGFRGGLVELERAEPKTARFEIDINSADWQELVQLPQIGEKLAERIVASRRSEGLFRDHRDLLRVRGIGPKTLELISPHLRPISVQGGASSVLFPTGLDPESSP